MKINFTRIVLIGILILAGGFKAFALSAGDIAFTMYNSGPNSSATTPQHEFSFVTLVDLAAGTIVYFTDAGVDSSGAFFSASSSRESVIQYTTSGTVSAGSQITIGNTYSGTTLTGTSVIQGAGTAAIVSGNPFGDTGTSLSLSGSSGDSLIAYTASSATSTPTFITALDDVSGGGWATSSTGANDSALPPGLGTNALSFNLTTALYAQFKFSSIGGTIPSSNSKEAWDAILNDTTNWNVSTSAGYTASTTSLTVTAIPEPASYVVLAGLASFGLALRLRRKI